MKELVNLNPKKKARGGLEIKFNGYDNVRLSKAEQAALNTKIVSQLDDLSQTFDSADPTMRERLKQMYAEETVKNGRKSIKNVFNNFTDRLRPLGYKLHPLEGIVNLRVNEVASDNVNDAVANALKSLDAGANDNANDNPQAIQQNPQANPQASAQEQAADEKLAEFSNMLNQQADQEMRDDIIDENLKNIADKLTPTEEEVLTKEKAKIKMEDRMRKRFKKSFLNAISNGSEYRKRYYKENPLMVHAMVFDEVKTPAETVQTFTNNLNPKLYATKTKYLN